MTASLSLLANLKIVGALVLNENLADFPVNPKIGTLVIKDQALYAYIVIGGIPSWYPMIKAPTVYTHVQDQSAATWTVVHNLDSADAWYQIQDADGNVMMPAGYVELDNNSFELQFSENVTGKVLVLTEAGNGSNSTPAVPPAVPLKQFHYAAYPGEVTSQVGKTRWYPPQDVSLTNLTLMLDQTANLDIEFDILKNGASIWPGPALMFAGENKHAFPITGVQLSTDDYLTFNIVNGNGSDLSFRLDYETTTPAA